MDGIFGIILWEFEWKITPNKVVQHPATMSRRTVIENYDLKSICLPKQIELLGKLA
jgi:hypothetical protein